MSKERKSRSNGKEVKSGPPKRGLAPLLRIGWLLGAVAMVVFGIIALGRSAPNDAIVAFNEAATAGSVEPPLMFHDVRAQTKEFVAYNRSIKLTSEQELVRQEALSSVPAPCCADNSADTCCCPCNMAKSWWGLSNHLIADQGYEAKEVAAAVEGWIEFINPDGFSGDACYTGGCSRPFDSNGCGGMNESQIVF